MALSDSKIISALFSRGISSRENFLSILVILHRLSLFHNINSVFLYKAFSSFNVAVTLAWLSLVIRILSKFILSILLYPISTLKSKISGGISISDILFNDV